MSQNGNKPYEKMELSRGWIGYFLRQNFTVKVMAMQSIDNYRASSVSAEHICQHIGRGKATVQRYRRMSRNYIRNCDGYSLSLKEALGRKRKYAIGPKQSKVVRCIGRTTGNLDHVTVMSVLSAMGRKYKPVIVFSGRELHYRVVNID